MYILKKKPSLLYVTAVNIKKSHTFSYRYISELYSFIRVCVYVYVYIYMNIYVFLHQSICVCIYVCMSYMYVYIYYICHVIYI